MNDENTRRLQDLLLACLAFIDAAMLCGGLGLVPQGTAWMIGLLTGILAFVFMRFIYLGGNSVSHGFFFRYGLVVGFSLMFFAACLIVGLTLVYGSL